MQFYEDWIGWVIRGLNDGMWKIIIFIMIFCNNNKILIIFH